MEPVQKRMKMNSQEHGAGIMDLPNEVLEIIFLKLSPYDVQHNVALVCSRFLNIIRRPVFVQSVEIEPKPIKVQHWLWPTYDFPNSCLKKMEKIKKFYPNCNFELVCTLYEPLFQIDAEREAEEIRHTLLIGYSWMKKFLPYASSLTKLTLAVNAKFEDYSDFILLQNLEYLDLDVSMEASAGGDIHKLGAEFWSNFPILKSLKIKTKFDYETCVSKL